MTQPLPAFRLVSVDVFRGCTMAAMVVVNTPGDWNHVYAPLLHAEWNGWTPTDLIFPFFVFILGVSIVLSPRSRGPVDGVLRRTALLYGLGLLLALYPSFSFSTVRVMGVLPRLAVCYLAGATIIRPAAGRGDAYRLRLVLGTAAVLLLGYWAALTFVPPPGGMAGDLTPSGNLGAWLDRTILGEAHLWRQSRTWDPEGLLSTVPAIATALTGIAAGVVFRGSRSTRDKLVWLIGAGVLGVVAGLAWDRTFPINKNLWTSSYVLFTSGLASIALAICYWVLDVNAIGGTIVRPFVILGSNALALFVLSGWLVKTLIWIKLPAADGASVSLYNWIFRHVFAPWASPTNASVLFALAALGVLYGVLALMHRRRWFFRV